MKLSKLSFKPLKNPPKEADTVNHRLLVQAGFVKQLMAGIFIYSPLGLRVLNNIKKIIREEIDAVGGQEILMPSLHPKKNWIITGGWDNIEVLFKIQSRTGREFALGQSHEEVVTPLAKELIKSYRDLPLALYQIQWKFRDELRAKSGILRGREFEMKDLYSFHETQEDFDKFYQQTKEAYLKIFTRLGLVAKVTEASGGNFTDKFSYEFMVLTDAGEDDILYCSVCDFCVNVDIAKHKEHQDCPNCKKSKLKSARASEVGNVFDLGEKYTKDFNLKYTAKDGSQKYPIMGCYGIGTTRTMGVIVEKFNDDKGILWPKEVSPFATHLVSLAGSEDQAKNLYHQLQKSGVEVLWDDRDISAGQKFADADLVGIPIRLIVSKKTAEKVEWKERGQAETKQMTTKEVLQKLKAHSG